MPDSLVALRDRRDQVIARLSDGYAADLFDVDELDRRLDLAHAARTVAELDALVADLPQTALAVASPRAIDDPSRPPAKKLRVILGSIERRARWTVPSRLELRLFCGSAELDFREASLASGVTTLDVRVTMSSLELIVPPWLAVDVDVSSILGDVEQRHRTPVEPDPAQPILRITGTVALGALEIETRLPGESGRDARKRMRRERKARRRRELPSRSGQM